MKKYIAAASIVAIVILAYFLIQPQPPPTIGDTAVFVDPLNITVPFLSNFTLNVSCAPTQPIKAFEFFISFNPSFLQANNVTEGDFFEGYPTYFSPGIINNSEGTIKNIYGLIIGQGNVTENGTLININFTTKDNLAQSEIKITNIGLTNETMYLSVVVYNGTIHIKEVYMIILDSGWNLKSWPTLHIIPKDNISVIYNTTTYTWQEACNNIIIAPWIYSYDGIYVESQVFYPYYGYWIYSHHDGVILIYDGSQD